MLPFFSLHYLEPDETGQGPRPRLFNSSRTDIQSSSRVRVPSRELSQRRALPRCSLPAGFKIV